VTKTCRKCGFVGPPEAFHKTSNICLPCRKVEARLRYVKDTERFKERARARYAANKESIKKQTAAWAAKNRDRVLEYGRRFRKRHPEYYQSYSAKNREAIRAKKRAWYAANKAVALVSRKLRKRRVRFSPGRATTQQILWRFEVFGWCCAYCGAPATHMDHAIPISRGGSNWPANLKPSCAPCNLRKHARPFKVWMGIVEQERASHTQKQGAVDG